MKVETKISAQVNHNILRLTKDVAELFNLEVKQIEKVDLSFTLPKSCSTILVSGVIDEDSHNFIKSLVIDNIHLAVFIVVDACITEGDSNRGELLKQMV
jgi:hypothetical protein